MATTTQPVTTPFAAVKPRTSIGLWRAVSCALVLAAWAFMASVGSIEIATAMDSRFPDTGFALVVLPSLVICFCIAMELLLHAHESGEEFEIDMMPVILLAVVFFASALLFKQFSYSDAGKSLVPGWAHARGLSKLRVASEEIKTAGGTLDSPSNKLILEALATRDYDITRLAYEQYDKKEITGEAYSRWIMAHRLYPIYDAAMIDQLQAVGWANQDTLDKVKKRAIRMSPPAGSTLIQQHAWAVLAGEIDPKLSMGQSLEAK